MSKSDNVSCPVFTKDMIYIGKGCECQVFEIVKSRLVCKVYYSHNDARYNYILQRIGYRAGIAPEPLALEYNYYFSRYVESWEKFEDEEKSFYEVKNEIKFQNFLNKIRDVFGGNWNDGHSGNVGMVVVNGITRYVVIDFGVAGFEHTVLGKLLSAKLDIYWR